MSRHARITKSNVKRDYRNNRPYRALGVNGERWLTNGDWAVSLSALADKDAGLITPEGFKARFGESLAEPNEIDYGGVLTDYVKRAREYRAAPDCTVIRSPHVLIEGPWEVALFAGISDRRSEAGAIVFVKREVAEIVGWEVGDTGRLVTSPRDGSPGYRLQAIVSVFGDRMVSPTYIRTGPTGAIDDRLLRSLVDAHFGSGLERYLTPDGRLIDVARLDAAKRGMGGES